MKSKFLNCLVIAGFILILGCDVVKEPVFYEPVDIIKYGLCDTTALDPSLNDTTITKDYAGRKILLEDYTGHTCGNCPSAGLKLKEMLAAHGEQIVGMGVHAGFFAEPYESGDEFRTDFRTDAGEEYFTTLNVGSNPNGVVNRRKYNNKLILGIDQWDAAISDFKSTGRLASIKMTNVYNSERRVDFLNVDVAFDSTTTNSYKLILMITEDNVVDWQLDYSLPKEEQHVENYVHKHVLRDNLNNSVWGEPVGSGSINAGDAFSFSSQYCVSSDWNDAECHMVAVLYNTSTYEVVQCEEVKIRK